MNSNLKGFLAVAIFTVVLIGVGGVAVADSGWYSVAFTGADIWHYSPYGASQTPRDQTAPRRYRDFTTSPSVVATTYGVGGGTTSTTPGGTPFGVWATGDGSGFAFDELNLWGIGGAPADAWGEYYTSVGTGSPDYGVSSWRMIQTPTGWTSGIVEGDQTGYPMFGDTHGFPVWYSGADNMLSQANMTDPSFMFKFLVLVSDASTAIDQNGNMRVWFGGFNDDTHGDKADNYEVSGIMTLHATQVSGVDEPGFILLLGIGLGAVILICRFKA